MSGERHASCSCGGLRLVVAGEPVRISMCHCLACQRRTGSVFSAQARFHASGVRIEGESTEFVRVSDAGERRVFRFCPVCGATVYYTDPSAPDLIAVPIGAFADPGFPPPRISVWEERRHPWVSTPDGAEHVG